MHYTLTVYAADDETPLFEVGTDSAHPNPYLHLPGEFDQAEVDLLRGTSAIGQINLRIIDKQTGASQAERWLTARLAVPAGEVGAGFSALNGRRAVLAFVGGIEPVISSVEVDGDDLLAHLGGLDAPATRGPLVLDGVIQGVTLSESFAGFGLALQDIRSRQRRTSLFTRAALRDADDKLVHAPTVLPRGVLGGYGRLPNGEWLVPPTAPLRGIYAGNEWTGRIRLNPFWLTDSYDPKKAEVSAEHVLTDAMRKASGITKRSRDGYGQVYGNVVVLWRVEGSGGAWKEVRDIDGLLNLGQDGLFRERTARLRREDGSYVDVPAVSDIWVTGYLPGPDGQVSVAQELPADGQTVEVLVCYVGEPSEDYPLHYEGTAGELLRDVYRGVYSEEPPRVRYDEAALLALTTPVRLRIDKALRGDRALLNWTEKLYQALGAAPALDGEGRISPVRAALPPVDQVLPEINDANAQAIPGWEHPMSRAVSAVSVSYERDYRVPAERDPLGERSAGDGIASREVTVERQAPAWVRALVGEESLEIDGRFFRALGGTDGEPVTGDVTDEAAHQIALARTHEVLDRWVFGGQTSFCRVLAAEFPALREGDWVLDARSWRPDYLSGRRGGNALAQVVSVRVLNPAWLELRLIDAAPADQPLAQPVLGALSVDAQGVVSVPVTSVPSGAEVRVEYAVSATVPLASSGLWTFGARTAVAAPVGIPAAPAGVTVWIRARSEGAGRRPSAWTNATSIATPQTPRISGLTLRRDEDGQVRAEWERNGYALGLRLAWGEAASEEDAELTQTAEVDATTGRFALPASLSPRRVLVVEATPYPGWTGSAVSGTAGATVRRALVPTADVPAGTLALTVDERTGEVRVTANASTANALGYRYRVAVGAIGSDAFAEVQWSDAAADEFAGADFGVPRLLPAPHKLKTGEELFVEGYLLATSDTTAAAQQGATRSEPQRLSAQLGVRKDPALLISFTLAYDPATKALIARAVAGEGTRSVVVQIGDAAPATLAASPGETVTHTLALPTVGQLYTATAVPWTEPGGAGKRGPGYEASAPVSDAAGGLSVSATYESGLGDRVTEWGVRLTGNVPEGAVDMSVRFDAEDGSHQAYRRAVDGGGALNEVLTLSDGATIALWSAEPLPAVGVTVEFWRVAGSLDPAHRIGQTSATALPPGAGAWGANVRNADGTLFRSDSWVAAKGLKVALDADGRPVVEADPKLSDIKGVEALALLLGGGADGVQTLSHPRAGSVQILTAGGGLGDASLGWVSLDEIRGPGVSVGEGLWKSGNTIGVQLSEEMGIGPGLQFDADGGMQVDDTVSRDGHTHTWSEISGGTQPPPAPHGHALSDILGGTAGNLLLAGGAGGIGEIAHPDDGLGVQMVLVGAGNVSGASYGWVSVDSLRGPGATAGPGLAASGSTLYVKLSEGFGNESGLWIDGTGALRVDFGMVSAVGHSHSAAEVGAAAWNHSHTPAEIGAATAGHTHTPASIGAAAAVHYHDERYLSLGGGEVSGSITALSFYKSSSRDLKEHIRPLALDAGALLDRLEVVQYRYRGEAWEDVGYIVEDSPAELRSPDGAAVDIARVVALLVAERNQRRERHG